MNIRNVTIWTTGVMMIGTFIPNIVWVMQMQPASIPSQQASVLWMCWVILVLWAFGGSPLAVSLVIAIKSKCDKASLVLLISTIIFVCWFLFPWTVAILGYNGGACSVVFLFVLWIAPLSLVIMVPAWVSVLQLNRNYATQEPQM